MPNLKHKALWITVGAGLTALLVMGVVFFAFAAVVGNSSDYAGVALLITAIGTPLSVIISALAAWKASSADKQAVVTHTAVNSRMDEFKKLFEDKFKMEGAEGERAARRERAGVEAEARLTAGNNAAPATDASKTAASVLAAAELKAQALIADATLAAARLLADAHHVSITDPAANPVPVLVVGPEVDTPLKVTEAAKDEDKLKRGE